jgi:hypothetical protein
MARLNLPNYVSGLGNQAALFFGTRACREFES